MPQKQELQPRQVILFSGCHEAHACHHVPQPILSSEDGARVANALTACQLLSYLKHEILQFSQQAFALATPRCLATIQIPLSPKSHEFKSPLHLMIGEGCEQERYEASKMHLTPCSRHDVRMCHSRRISPSHRFWPPGALFFLAAQQSAAIQLPSMGVSSSSLCCKHRERVLYIATRALQGAHGLVFGLASHVFV